MKIEILQKAEALFFDKGFKAASLQELADTLNIKSASLYYHFPGGKEEIYVAVLKNRLDQYRLMIEKISHNNSNIEKFIREFSLWYIEQPAMNMDLIAKVDMPHLTAKSKQEIMALISLSLFRPLQTVFKDAAPELKNIDPMKLVGIYINLLNGMSYALTQGYVQKEDLVQDFLEVLLRGMTK